MVNKVDLGNVRGSKGDAGGEGRGIESVTVDHEHSTEDTVMLDVLYSDGDVDSVPVDRVTFNVAFDVDDTGVAGTDIPNVTAVRRIRADLINRINTLDLLDVVESLPTGSAIKPNHIYLLIKSTPNNDSLNTTFDIKINKTGVDSPSAWTTLDELTFSINDYYTAQYCDEHFAPIPHSSGNTTYGVGSSSAYGHLKVKDNYTSNGGNASQGVSASSKAVYDTYTEFSSSSKTTKNAHVHGNISTDGKVGTTENKPLITGTGGAVTTGKFEDDVTNIKANGTVSVGSSNNFARSDHIHPSDSNKASSNHTHGIINNNGSITDGANKNVVTDGSGNISIVDMPHMVTYVNLSDDLDLFIGYDDFATTTLTSSSNNVNANSNVILSATVIDNDNNNPLEDLTVKFYDGNTLLGTGVTNSSGVATLTYTPTVAGSLTIKAYLGSLYSNTVTVVVV